MEERSLDSLKSKEKTLVGKVPNYKAIRQNAENFYKKIGKIHCPALGDVVYFNSEGFNHLLYKNKSVRPQKEQAIKFKLVVIAKELVEKSHLYQEYDENLVKVVQKKFGKKTKGTLLAKYWGFVGVIRGCRAKAIVRQVGNGNKHFWSVILCWGNNQYRNTKIISNFRGNLVDD